MADDYQGEISNLLHRHQIFTRHEKPIPKVASRNIRGQWVQVVTGWESPARATPDLTGGRSKQVHVEVKTGKDGRWAFDSWTPEQMEWAAEWREKYGCEYWLAIVIEAQDARYAKGQRNKRAAFIVPYPVVMDTIRDTAPHQLSLPYSHPRLIALRERGLWATNVWDKFELFWEKGGWQFPENHPFFKAYCEDKPYLYPFG